MKKTDYVIFLLVVILLILLIQLVAGFIKKDIHPHDRIGNLDINLESNKLTIYGEYKLGSFVGGSMFPSLFKNSTSIDIVPSSSDKIYIGDVITFENPNGKVISHRVINIKEDKQGIYFITKGDNNYIKDKYKVRFEDIESITVGALW